MTKNDENIPTDPEAQETHALLLQVNEVLSKLLGRPSRWTGQAELTDNPFTSGIAHIDGRIEITRSIWREPQYRWRTVIHELLHLFSPEYTRYQYSMARGWEEGLVEQMQRLLRRRVLDTMNVPLDDAVFEERDRQHEYNRYIQALERLRSALGEEALPFYTWLLVVPLPNRAAAVRERGDALLTEEKARQEFRYTLLLSQATLGRE